MENQNATELKTVKAFKDEWSISDETFRQYRKASTEKTGIDPVERRGSKTWVIVDEQAILDVMPSETKLRKQSPTVEVQSASIVKAEIVEDSEPDQPSSIIPYANGFKANSALTFTSSSSQEVADHIIGEVVESGNNVNQSLQAFFGATQDQDEQLGIYIGAKRLERVFGTADSVFMQGLEQRAKNQGLGKQEEGKK